MNAIIDNEIKTIENDIKVDAKAIWDWFEQHIGITHTTQGAAMALNAIVPKPLLVEPKPLGEPIAQSSEITMSETILPSGDTISPSPNPDANDTITAV